MATTRDIPGVEPAPVVNHDLNAIVAKRVRALQSSLDKVNDELRVIDSASVPALRSRVDYLRGRARTLTKELAEVSALIK